MPLFPPFSYEGVTPMKNKIHSMSQRLSAAVMATGMTLACTANSFAAGGIDIDIGQGGITIKPPGMNPSIGGDDYLTGLVGFVDKYKQVAILVLAVCIITAIICLVYNITRLSAAGASSNPHAKQMALMGILISCIALALFGGLSIVVGFFWNLLLPGGI